MNPIASDLILNSTNYTSYNTSSLKSILNPLPEDALTLPDIPEKTIQYTEETPDSNIAGKLPLVNRKWSPKELEVIYTTIGNHPEGKYDYYAIKKQVNRIAKADGVSKRTIQACITKISRIRFQDELRLVVNSGRNLSEKEESALAKRPFSENEREALRKLVENGWSIYAIALEFGRTLSVCTNEIRQLKLQLLENEAAGALQSLTGPEIPTTVQPRYIPQDDSSQLNQFEFIPINKIPATSFESGKRKEAPADSVSQPKRVRRQSSTAKTGKHHWSKEQLEVIRNCVNSAGMIPVYDLDKITATVNSLAAQSQGDHHSKRGCSTKIDLLKVEKRIRLAIDPTQTMTEEAILLQMNKPITNDEVDRLITLYNQGISIRDIAVVIKRKLGAVEEKIKRLKLIHRI